MYLSTLCRNSLAQLESRIENTRLGEFSKCLKNIQLSQTRLREFSKYLNKKYLLLLIGVIILKLSRRYTKKQYKTFFNLIYYFIKSKIYHNLYGINLIKINNPNNNKHIYYKEYYFNDNFYRFIISTDFKVLDTFYSATDENNNDITDEIVKYIGPNNDFHNLELTPLMLGYKTINLTVDDKEIVFNENDILKIYDFTFPKSRVRSKEFIKNDN